MSKFTISCELDRSEDVGDIATIIELYTGEPENVIFNPVILEGIMNVLFCNFCDYAQLNRADMREHLSAEIVQEWIARLSTLRETLLKHD